MIGIVTGDCLEALPAIATGTVDAIVTDPPYGLGFMGKAWDDLPPGLVWATECLRVLKPGGHLLAFGGTRTSHRLVCAIEDAGFEIRDGLVWLYGSGFPKSHDVSKAIDKAAGVEGSFGDFKSERHSTWVKGYDTGKHEGYERPWTDDPEAVERNARQYIAGTPEAERWEGWGTALKPAHEPIVLARKPLIGTVAANVLAHGVGALHVDACRIVGDVPGTQGGLTSGGIMGGSVDGARREPFVPAAGGRWPANVLLDPEAAAMLDEQTGQVGAASPVRGTEPSVASDGTVTGKRARVAGAFHADSGGASRFFYVAKASSKERNAGLEGFAPAGRTDDGYGSIQTPILDRATPRENWTPREKANNHPTVKPVELMRWLVRLITPPGGLVIDPFAGSGTTGVACALEGVNFIGIEREADYAEIARARIIGVTA